MALKLSDPFKLWSRETKESKELPPEGGGGGEGHLCLAKIRSLNWFSSALWASCSSSGRWLGVDPKYAFHFAMHLVLRAPQKSGRNGVFPSYFFRPKSKRYGLYCSCRSTVYDELLTCFTSPDSSDFLLIGDECPTRVRISGVDPIFLERSGVHFKWPLLPFPGN